MTGIERQHTVFFLEDHHMVKSEFLESINSLLSCGDVPGIWTPDELEPLLAPLKEEWAASQGRGAVQARTPFEYFVHQVRSHMRIVLSMDANHPHFLTFCAANPALISCCNVMWLDDWSEKSVHFVVQRQLTDVSPAAPHVDPQVATYAWSLAKRLRHIAAHVQGYLQGREICTKGIRANWVTFNELLHARAFACAGARGRPWPMSPSMQLVLTLSKRMTEITISFGTSVGLLATNGGENGPFVSKREARDAKFPSWAEGWLHSWLLRKAQLCESLAENQRS